MLRYIYLGTSTVPFFSTVASADRYLHTWNSIASMTSGSNRDPRLFSKSYLAPLAHKQRVCWKYGSRFLRGVAGNASTRKVCITVGATVKGTAYPHPDGYLLRCVEDFYSVGRTC